jgi:hypothetical protein
MARRILFSLFAWVYLLGFMLPGSALAQASQPLVTRYVQCVRDQKGRNMASRTVRTPIFESKQGVRAYGVVTAAVSSAPACQNTTTIYIAGRGEHFRVAFRQGPEALPDSTVYDGNGVEAIRWSPAGERLLVEVSQWAWGTDSSWSRRYVLIDLEHQTTRDLPLISALNTQFGKECVRQVTSKGWIDDTRIEVEVSPAREVDEEGNASRVPSCVQKPTAFSFDITAGSLRPGR